MTGEDLARRLYDCPCDLECGPCRRLIGMLIELYEIAPVDRFEVREIVDRIKSELEEP